MLAESTGAVADSTPRTAALPVLVSSGAPRQGVSTVAAELASMLARVTGREVLLISCSAAGGGGGSTRHQTVPVQTLALEVSSSDGAGIRRVMRCLEEASGFVVCDVSAQLPHLQSSLGDVASSILWVQGDTDDLPEVPVLLRHRKHSQEKKPVSVYLVRRTAKGVLPARWQTLNIGPHKHTMVPIPNDGVLCSRTIFALARRIAGRTIGVAFGAGGARGFAHLGVMRVLERLEVPIDYVAGTSMGAVLGALVAQGRIYDEMEKELEPMAALIMRSLFTPTVPYRAVFSGRGLRRAIRAAMGDVRFEDLPIPFSILTADCITGQKRIFTEGPLWEAAVASCSIPLLFPPVAKDGQLLVDGAVVEPVPVFTVRQQGAGIVVASVVANHVPDSMNDASLPLPTPNVKSDPRAKLPANLLDVYIRSIGLMHAHLAEAHCRAAEVVVWPRFPTAGWRQFDRYREFIACGEQAAYAAVPALRSVCPWV